MSRSLKDFMCQVKNIWYTNYKKCLFMVLKQAPQALYSKLDTTFIELGLNLIKHELVIYFKGNSDSKICVGVYMDDLLISRGTDKKISKFKEKMNKVFSMFDIGLLSAYLSIQVKHIKGDMQISQKSFASKILYDFNMQNDNPCQPHLKSDLLSVKRKEIT